MKSVLKNEKLSFLSPSLPLCASIQHFAHALTSTIPGAFSSCRFCPVSVGNEDFPSLIVLSFWKAWQPWQVRSALSEWLERGQLCVLQPHSWSCQGLCNLCPRQAQGAASTLLLGQGGTPGAAGTTRGAFTSSGFAEVVWSSERGVIASNSIF